MSIIKMGKINCPKIYCRNKELLKISKQFIFIVVLSRPKIGLHKKINLWTL